jgi:hypothetical protein
MFLRLAFEFDANASISQLARRDLSQVETRVKSKVATFGTSQVGKLGNTIFIKLAFPTSASLSKGSFTLVDTPG